MEIKIKNKDENKEGWRILVGIGEGEDEIEYSVWVEKKYWQKLTGEGYEPEELVRKSFEFLLQREPKESILKEFALRQISDYFPEYEEEMKRQMP